MVTTRHSLPHNASHEEVPTTSTTISSPTPTATEDIRTLADLDHREARRLATNAKFDDDDDGAKDAGELGTYHWRGAVYAITRDTPREWIEQGEAEWANGMRKRERIKKEREEGAEMRRKEEVMRKEEVVKRKRGGVKVEEKKEVEVERKKRKRTIEVEEKVGMTKKRRRTTSNTLRPRSTLPSKSTLPSSSSRSSRPSLPRPSRPRSSTSSSTRKRAEVSASSTASSNIEVAHTRRSLSSNTTKKARSKKSSHPPPTNPQHDIPSESPSEDDSAGDLPTVRPPRNFHPDHRDRPDRNSLGFSKNKRHRTFPHPVSTKPTRDAVMQSLSVGLYALGKTNDRVEQLKKWWDGVRKEGAFQRLIEIVKKMKEGKGSERGEEESLRDFADSVADDANVQLLLRDMAVEEEQLEEERRRSSTLHEENNEDAMMVEVEVEVVEVGEEEEEDDDDEGMIPTPESEEPIRGPINAHQLPILMVQPTPPASSIDEAHDEEGEEEVHPTPPISPSGEGLLNKSPRVLIPSLLLPTQDRGGNPLRWTLHPAKINPIKLKTEELKDEGRAEYAIYRKRLDGESRTQRRRRVRRELREMGHLGDSHGGDYPVGVTGGGGGGRGGGALTEDGWTIIPHPNPEEEDDYPEIDDVVYEHREEMEEGLTGEIEGISERVRGGGVDLESRYVGSTTSTTTVDKVLGARVGRGKNRKRMRGMGKGKGRAS